jgi:hypothetical protein
MKSNALLAWGPIHDNQVGMPHNVDDDADSLAVNLSHIIADFETLHDRPSTEAWSRATISAFRSRASRVSSLRRVRPAEPYLETNSHAPSSRTRHIPARVQKLKAGKRLRGGYGIVQQAQATRKTRTAALEYDHVIDEAE